jgi:hypothetical protein|tara:strand:+ start:24915 stop:25136 length:222 start_codon:yes stop_codon:yes gene_type:complete
MTWDEIKKEVNKMTPEQLQSEALIRMHWDEEAPFQNITMQEVDIKENYEYAYNEYLFDHNIPDGKVIILSTEA